MKLPSLLAIALLAALPLASAADAFEGTISTNMTDEKAETGTMNFSIKGDLTRLELSQGQMMVTMLMDASKQDMVMIMPPGMGGMPSGPGAPVIYMTVPVAQAAAAATQVDNTPPSSFVKTSVTEKIAGYDTVKYTSKSGGNTTDIWLTDELGKFPGINNPAGNMAGRGGPMGAGSEWADELRGKSLFPLRVISHSSDGKLLGQLEVTAVEKKSLPASLFAPPAGAIDLRAMMRGGMPPQGMPGTTPAAPRRGN